MMRWHKYLGRIVSMLAFGSVLIVGGATAQESRLDRVTVQKKVAIGIGYAAPPMNYMDRGVWAGFDMDLAAAIARHLPTPVAVEFVKVDTTTRVVFLAAGRVDMTISSMSHTR